MSYIDFLTTSQQALVLGRTPAEALDLLQYGLELDLKDMAEVTENADKLERAGYGVADFRSRERSLARSIRQSRDAISAVRAAIAEAA